MLKDWMFAVLMIIIYTLIPIVVIYFIIKQISFLRKSSSEKVSIARVISFLLIIMSSIFIFFYIWIFVMNWLHGSLVILLFLPFLMGIPG